MSLVVVEVQYVVSILGDEARVIKIGNEVYGYEAFLEGPSDPFLARMQLFLKDIPEHSHPGTDEALTVMQGELGVRLDGGEEIVLAVGDRILIPRGVDHSYRLISKAVGVFSFKPNRAGNN